MSSVFLLIPLTLVLLALAVAAFSWAVRHDQFDDLERHAGVVLFEEDDVDAGVAPTRAASSRSRRQP